MIGIKRIYDSAAKGDGARVLVDRVWPRGVSKKDARLDEWLKDVAPSTELRKWFGHDADKWAEFKRRYRAELKQRPDKIAKLHGMAEKGDLTLLYGAKDEDHNQAVVLRDYLEKKSWNPPSARQAG
jgi:uncharacterized protein YeaO (DUF488 family)